MPAASACPDAADLQRLLLGQIRRPDAERLEQHLGQCSRCSSTAMTLRAEDTLVEALRAAAQPPLVESGEEVPDGLIERLKQLRGARPNGIVDPVTRNTATHTPDLSDPQGKRTKTPVHSSSMACF
jgi:hypothetical protein